MAGRKKDPVRTAWTREMLLKKSFELFTARNIESVSMTEIARECGCSAMTLYRYFSTKTELVVAVASWKWQLFFAEYRKHKPDVDLDGVTAAAFFDYFLDAFVLLFREYRDLLRFNQFFNIYIQSEKMDADTIGPYQEVILDLKKDFHDMYRKGEKDHTVKTDVPEQKMFAVTLHLMLAAVTRYAVGLVYQPDGGEDLESELLLLKRMILREFTTDLFN